MPYGTSPHSRYRWRADREPEKFYSGLFSPSTEDRYDGMLAIGLLEVAILGSLVADLEPAVDASYQRDADGTIVGRAPGIRGWLAENAPELLPHNKALMAYKRLAERFLLACRLDEPGTAEELLAIRAPGRPTPARVRRTVLAKPRREAAALLAALPRPTLRALDEELHRRLGLVRRRRGPRRRRSA